MKKTVCPRRIKAIPSADNNHYSPFYDSKTAKKLSIKGKKIRRKNKKLNQLSKPTINKFLKNMMDNKVKCSKCSVRRMCTDFNVKATICKRRERVLRKIKNLTPLEIEGMGMIMMFKQVLFLESMGKLDNQNLKNAFECTRILQQIKDEKKEDSRKITVQELLQFNQPKTNYNNKFATNIEV